MAVEMTEGTKKDAGKLPIHLFPTEALFAACKVLEFGAKKYAERNWEQGMDWSRVWSALMRHMWCWWAGKQPTSENFVFGSLDDETKFSHLWHAMCCIVFLVTYEERKVGTDDRPVGKVVK